MIPADAHTFALFVKLCLGCAAASLVLAYVSHEPVKSKAFVRRAFKLILGLLSYPLVLGSIIMIYALSLVMTIVRYTAGRIGGQSVTKINLKVTFD